MCVWNADGYHVGLDGGLGSDHVLAMIDSKTGRHSSELHSLTFVGGEFKSETGDMTW